MAPLLQALRDLKGEVLVPRAIFGVQEYPKHLLSAGKYHTGPVGDIPEEKLKKVGDLALKNSVWVSDSHID